MQDKRREKQFYDKMFSRRTDGHFISEGYEEIYRKSLDTVPKGIALDVGCGNGKHTVHMAKRGFTTVGIDLSLKGVLAARRHAEREKCNVLFLVADAENMPFKNEVFDVVFCGLLLHHFPHLDRVSTEIGRVANGHLFALETNALEPITFLKFNVINPLLKPPFMTPNQRALCPNRVQKTFERQGFSCFAFSWFDIHVPYKGIIAVLTKIYVRMFKLLPLKNRSNKFLMACCKSSNESQAKKA